MSKYFDKDFFKFFLGFAAIISLSLIMIVAVRMYQ
jgi:predicted ferric reductase